MCHTSDAIFVVGFLFNAISAVGLKADCYNDVTAI